MTAKWNMIVDVARCENCRNCFLVTKDEHIGNEFPDYAAPQPKHEPNWVDIERKERGRWPMVEANFMQVMCNHCDDAPCMKAAKDGAITKRDDGIVIIDPKKSKGQRTQEAEYLEVLKPDLNTKPRVYYKNLRLMTKCFVAGSVVVNVEGVEDCAADAEVVPKHNGSEIARATTDTFGEFKIDKLEQNSGPYQLEATLGSSGSATRDFDVSHESLDLGTNELTG